MLRISLVCQLLTLSRVDGILGISVMRSLAQAPGGANSVSSPDNELCTPSVPSPTPLSDRESAAMGKRFRWQDKAKEHQDRIGNEPLRSIAEEQGR